MRIGVDARLINESGVGRYIRNLLFHLAKIDKKNQYFVFIPSDDFRKTILPKNFQKIQIDIPWYSLKEQIQFPKVLYKYNLDLMHFPHFNVPIAYKGKFVVTVHDLIHQHFAMKRATTHGNFTYFIKKFGYRFVFSSALKNSQRVITVSNFVKKQLIEEWNVRSEKIEVTYEAVDESILFWSKKNNKSQINRNLKKFNIKDPFIFYVGNAHPHKNVEGLIRSFLKLRKQYKYLTLVLSGKDHYFWQRIKNKFGEKDIVYTGFITDQQLVSFYQKAFCLVIPSFEEGFGIPVLEAFACGCPVVASKIGALVEVGRDSCLYFDPYNLEDMQQKIALVVSDSEFRNDLITRGKKRYNNFSWRDSAWKTLEVYSLCE